MTTTPTDFEQYMLELVNRARANPAAEGQRLLAIAQTDPLVRSATAQTNLAAFVQKISSFAPLPPLAFNTRLIEAARAENAAMLAQNSQRHAPAGFLNNPAVAVASDGLAYYDTTGVAWSTGENIFGFSANVNSPSLQVYVDYFYAGFMIDWGNPDYGHLTNILAPGPAEAAGSPHYPFSEVGIGLLTGVVPLSPPDPNPPNPANAGISVGPDLVAQEFGWRSSSPAFLTGTFYVDAGHTGFYAPGEGLGNVTIQAVGLAGQGTYQTQTWSSGGYSLPLPAGTYRVTASGGVLPGTRATTVTIGADNVPWTVRVDLQATADLPVVADYNGDGRADLATYRTTTGDWTIRNSADGSTSVIPFGWAGVDIPVPGKYDGGPAAEVAVYRPVTGEWIINSPGGGRVVRFGWPGHDVPVPGDYDGDGKTDLAVYRPETAQWIILRSSDGRGELYAFGAPGLDQPVAADYNGDGRTDLAVFRPSTAEWYIRSSSNGATSGIKFGWPGQDLPRPADYDGDGRVDIGVYRPLDATWYLLPSTLGTTRIVPFGWAGVDQPIPADYDGDGKADIAVFRPQTAEWYVRATTTGATDRRRVRAIGVADDRDRRRPPVSRPPGGLVRLPRPRRRRRVGLGDVPRRSPTPAGPRPPRRDPEGPGRPRADPGPPRRDHFGRAAGLR